MAQAAAPPRVDRRLAAILAADVFGYSRLMGADEESILAQLKAHRRQLVDPKIKQHHGRIVKTTGDGMLVEFAAIPLFEEAIRISPRDSDSLGMFLHLGLAHILLRHDDAALEWCLKARALNPKVMYVHYDLAAAYGLKGNETAARASLAEALKLQPKLSIAWLRARSPSDDPKFNRLREDTLFAGLRKAGLREDDTVNN